MKKIIFFASIFVLFFSGCSTKEYKLFQEEGVDSDKETFTIIPEDEYNEEMVFENIIAPNDRVDISIFIQAGQGSQQMQSLLTSEYNNENLRENIGLLVTQKGTVRLPLLGSVFVSGLTQDEASNYLIKKYKKYIRNPYVLVEIKNQRVIVMGEVRKPGVVPVTNGTMNVLEAIARSGDLTNVASRNNIKVVRGNLRKPIVRNIDLTSMNALALSSLYLKPNDIVYVQPRALKGYNKAFNEINPFFNMLSSILDPLNQRKTLIE